MNRDKLKHYKEILLNEQREIQKTLKKMEDNEYSANLQEETSELSMYDNHPGDIGTETFQMEMQYALENHQKEALKNIEEALRKIETGNYGVCEYCGKKIINERLKNIPSTKLCSYCADKKLTPKNIKDDRPIEEEVLYPPFGRTNTDLDDSVIYDGEDSWQDVEQYSSSSEIKNDRSIRGNVKNVEEVSNEEYRKQLSD